MQLHQLITKIRIQIDKTDFGPTVVHTTRDHTPVKVVQTIPVQLLTLVLNIYLTKHLDPNLKVDEQIVRDLLECEDEKKGVIQ